MIVYKQLLDTLTAQAKASPRLRMNLDLRNSPSDGSQRMLNAIEPGSVLPIHRHTKSSETVVWRVALNIPMGQWHTVEALESGTVILECKDGAYEPLGEGDIL